jgi:hypothetical protein
MVGLLPDYFNHLPCPLTPRLFGIPVIRAKFIADYKVLLAKAFNTQSPLLDRIVVFAEQLQPYFESDKWFPLDRGLTAEIVHRDIYENVLPWVKARMQTLPTILEIDKL